MTKLKVVELKEKLQELGKIPKGKSKHAMTMSCPCRCYVNMLFALIGLKADLVNQLAEAYEEQSNGMGEQSAPLQAYPPHQAPAPMVDPMLTAESSRDPILPATGRSVPNTGAGGLRPNAELFTNPL